jgi:hypothetical protein
MIGCNVIAKSLLPPGFMKLVNDTTLVYLSRSRSQKGLEHDRMECGCQEFLATSFLATSFLATSFHATSFDGACQ